MEHDIKDAERLAAVRNTLDNLCVGNYHKETMRFVIGLFDTAIRRAEALEAEARRLHNYTTVFNAIAAATKIEGIGISISVAKFLERIDRDAPPAADRAGEEKNDAVIAAARRWHQQEWSGAASEQIRQTRRGTNWAIDDDDASMDLIDTILALPLPGDKLCQ